MKKQSAPRYYVVFDTEFNTYLGPFDSLHLAKRQVTTGYAGGPWLHSCGSRAEITSGKWVICRIVPEVTTKRFVSRKYGEGVAWTRVLKEGK